MPKAYEPEVLSATWAIRPDCTDAKQAMATVFSFAKAVTDLSPAFAELRMENKSDRIRDLDDMPTGWPRSYTSRQGAVTLLTKGGQGAIFGWHFRAEPLYGQENALLVRLPRPASRDADLWVALQALVIETWEPDDCTLEFWQSDPMARHPWRRWTKGGSDWLGGRLEIDPTYAPKPMD